MSLAVSKLGCTQLVFVKHDTKINSAHYRDELLMYLLPGIRSIADEVYIIQQDSTPQLVVHVKQ